MFLILFNTIRYCYYEFIFEQDVVFEHCNEFRKPKLTLKITFYAEFSPITVLLIENSYYTLSRNARKRSSELLLVIHINVNIMTLFRSSITVMGHYYVVMPLLL